MKKLINYVKKELILLIIGIFLSAFVVFFTILLPFIFGETIDLLSTNLLNNLDAFDALIRKKLLFALLIVIITSVLQFILSTINSLMAYKITKRFSNDLFQKVHRLPLSYLDQQKTGKLVSVIVTDVENIGAGLLLGLNQLFIGIMMILGTIAFMFYVNWVIAIVVIIVSPLSLFVARFIANKSYITFETQARIRSQQTSYIDEILNNVKIVKTFNYQKETMRKFDVMNQQLKQASFKSTFFSSLTNPCTRFVNSIVYALVALLGALFIVDTKLFVGFGIGSLSCLLSYANQYTKPFNEISSVIAEFQNALACSKRVFEFLELEEEDYSKEKRELIDIDGEVELNSVSFSYSKDKKLIKDLSLNVKPGCKVAIVGPTGCGKTTLINLLMRFYNVNEGKICIDNFNINHIFKQSLRDSYGMVLQETWIKNGTVFENVALGKEDASIEEVIDACKKSHAHSFIKKLPKGYNTVIGENYNLSQGQKQLLCISRVMLCMPPMLILDEATSSIDTNTELKIQDAFNTIMKGKTSFIVAHRLSTIKEADIILVMKDGDVVEKGNHKELLTNKGFYYELYNAQFIKKDLLDNDMMSLK